MPATEREIAAAVFKNGHSHGKLNVLLATPSKNAKDIVIDGLMEQMSGCTVICVEGLDGMHQEKEKEFFDVVIVSGLITAEKMFENEEKLDTLFDASMKALKLGGVLIVREDLNGYLATEKVAALTTYFDVHRVDDGLLGFEFHSLNQVNASIHTSQNFMDVYWTLYKKHFESSTTDFGTVTFRDFLDKTQYTDTGILAYEWIFGDDFISPGGAEENLAVLKRFGDMKAGEKMLDIGVGIGGGARQAASEFGLEVLGIDLSSNMLSIGMDRLHRDRDTRVRYQIANALEYDYEECSFDYVFSRDCLQHNDDMASMMRRIFKWLKPGGKMLITMYAKGHGELTQKFKDYVAQRHYFLKSLEEMVELTKEAGFENVQGTNMTERFKEILIEERSKAISLKDEFLQKFSESKLKDLIDGWNDKLGYIEADNHNWIQILAVKPEH